MSVALGVLALVPVPALSEPFDPPPAGTQYYSTAAPPATFPGPTPVQLALAETPPRSPTSDTPPADELPSLQPPQVEAPRVATTPTVSIPPPRSRPIAPPAEPPPATPSEASPVVQAKQAIAECRERYSLVQDYTCTFLKRERIDGRLSGYHILTMKARTRPTSFYFKFQKPTPGREAIYVAGRHGGRVLAHDVGIGKVIAGTLALDPKGPRAMEDCRHPITEAGIGHMIDTVHERWAAEMREGETLVTIHPDARVGNRSCMLIESTHPQHLPRYLFYQVKVYIDRELGLPIRFEGYDWPHHLGQPAELVEEYTYLNLRLNVGLRDYDFDPNNKQYSFGRF